MLFACVAPTPAPDTSVPLAAQFSLTINLHASREGGYRAARTNFTFLLLLLAVLLGSLIPVGFVIVQ